MQTTPFKRITLLMQAMAAAMSTGMSRWAALQTVGEYRSRGKGLGRRSGKKPGNPGTPWLDILGGQTNGRRECERRMRQMARNAAAA